MTIKLFPVEEGGETVFGPWRPKDKKRLNDLYTEEIWSVKVPNNEFDEPDFEYISFKDFLDILEEVRVTGEFSIKILQA